MLVVFTILLLTSYGTDGVMLEYQSTQSHRSICRRSIISHGSTSDYTHLCLFSQPEHLFQRGVRCCFDNCKSMAPSYMTNQFGVR